MTSRTEEALSALVAHLAADGRLPLISRNRTLPGSFEAVGGIGRFCNVVDGKGEPSSLLGAGFAAGTYEIAHRATVEWLVEAADEGLRSAAFEDGLDAIAAAIEADRTLGGAVDFAEIESVDRSQLATDGIPEIRAAEIIIRLDFTSARPF